MKKGWLWKPLGEVFKTGSGGTPLSSRKEYYEGGNIPWLVSGEVAQGNVREAKNFITKAGLENSAAKLFPTDTVLVAMYGATAGQVGILRFEAATNQAVCGIFPNDKFVPEFLFYFLLAKKDELVAQATGNAQPNISQIKIKNTEVPVPPLAEQQRIVGLLDEAFEGLATAKANAEKNLQNARALFESHLNDVFTKKGDGWLETTIGGVCDFRGGGTPSKAVERYWKGKIPWVSPKDMKSEIVSDSIDHISQEAIDASATSLIPKGAVLMVVRSGILARIVPLAVTGRELTINQDLKALCPKSVIESRFLYNLLESKMPELLSLVSRGATVHRLQTEQIRSLGCFLPPKAEQHQIIERIDSMRDETQRLARLYERKQAALEALKKSLLHQAFTGEL